MDRWSFSIPIPRFLRGPAPPPLATTPPPSAPPPLRPQRFGYFNEERYLANISATRVLGEKMAEAESAPTTPETPGSPVNVGALIRDGLDKGALEMLRTLSSSETDGEGNLRVDLKTRQDVFKMLMDWSVKREKTADVGDVNELPPYEKIRKHLDDMGFRIVSKVGRPSAEQLEKRAIAGIDETGAAKPPSPKEPPPKPAEDAALQKRLEDLARQREKPEAAHVEG